MSARSLFEDKARKVTSADIRAAMSKRWADPEYAIMWEVAQATGAVRTRYADAVIMSLWPSRGLELHGVEIKVSRSDWKREAVDPGKAEAVAQYCDRWWIHTSPGVVDDLSDLPPAWGLREYDGKAWHTVREAGKTEANPITRPFLAALLRRADGSMRGLMEEATRAARQKILDEAEERRRQFNEEVAAAVKRRTSELENVRENLAAFEAAFGIKMDMWADYPRLGAAAKALAACGSQYSASTLSARFREAAEEIDALAALSRPAAAE